MLSGSYGQTRSKPVVLKLLLKIYARNPHTKEDFFYSSSSDYQPFFYLFQGHSLGYGPPFNGISISGTVNECNQMDPLGFHLLHCQSDRPLWVNVDPSKGTQRVPGIEER